MYRSILAVAAVTGALALSACSETGTEPFAPEMSQVAEAPMGKPDFAGSNAAPRKGSESIARIATDGGYTELVGALSYVDENEGTELVKLFSEGTDQFTVFAPTNEAFTNLYALLSAVLEADIDEITDIPAPVVLDVLFYHVVEGRRAANSVLPRNGERTMSPLLGEYFYVRTDGSIRDGLTGVRADDATIGPANISASNGIIHVIDEVIVPPSVVAALTG